MSITLTIEDARWRKVRGLEARIKRAAGVALREGGAEGSLTLLLTTDARIKSLNHDFRGLNKPTNVLSFPAEAGEYLGDVAIAYGVTAKESKASGKTLSDHAVHLAVHGVLHLLGYDHVTAKKAKVMEPLEVAILERLKIADPYEAS